MSRTTASTPRVLRAFDAYNAARGPEDRVRPFNFLLSVTGAPFGHPEGVDPQRFHLVGPWNSDPTAWLGMTLFDLYSGEEYGITVEDDFGKSGRVLVRSYEDVLSAYVRHIEAKSLDSMGGRKRKHEVCRWAL